MKTSMMTRFGTLTAMALALTMIATTADARGGRGKRGGGGMGMGPRSMAALNLSNEQQTEIERLRLQKRQNLVETRAALREKRLELRALWAVDQPDERALQAKHKEMDPIRNQIRAEQIKFRLAVHQLLTPEQRAKAIEMAGQRKGRFGRGGRGGGMGGGGMGGGGMGGGGMGGGGMGGGGMGDGMGF